MSRIKKVQREVSNKIREGLAKMEVSFSRGKILKME